MDAIQKLRELGPPTRFEPAEEMVGSRRLPPSQVDPDLSDCITYAALPNGKRIAMLKTALTSACERDCHYCAFRRGRDFRRVSFSPDELARLFMQMHQRRLVEGIFLSSGIAGSGPRTQDRLIATAEILRRHHDFQGYIHLKIMPAAERDQVFAAMCLADRVSVNLEAPNSARLAELAPHKVFAEELLSRLRWVEEIRQEVPGRWPSSCTQFVVGATDESDAELLTTTESLYRQLRLARTYFSSFSPVPDTPLENHPPASPLRERRLYQSSFLLRDYGFTAEDLPFDVVGNLPLGSDPKLAWAQQHLIHVPVELNTADRRDLLRVPGIGPKNAEKVLHERQSGRLRYLSDLRKLGIVAERAADFVLLDGRRPPRQLTLWPVGQPDA
jgi:predicted DNA-binding helix-hairpin-helix protein